jgi:hypothetical protein
MSKRGRFESYREINFLLEYPVRVSPHCSHSDLSSRVLSAYASRLSLKILCFASVFVRSPFRSWPCAGLVFTAGWVRLSLLPRFVFHATFGLLPRFVAPVHRPLAPCSVLPLSLLSPLGFAVAGLRFGSHRAQPNFQAFDFLRPDFHAFCHRFPRWIPFPLSVRLTPGQISFSPRPLFTLAIFAAKMPARALFLSPRLKALSNAGGDFPARELCSQSSPHSDFVRHLESTAGSCLSGFVPPFSGLHGEAACGSRPSFFAAIFGARHMLRRRSVLVPVSGSRDLHFPL